MRCLAGLFAPTHGEVRHDGRVHTGLRGRRKWGQAARIGMVFQDLQLVERAAVGVQVLIGHLMSQPLLLSSHASCGGPVAKSRYWPLLGSDRPSC